MSEAFRSCRRLIAALALMSSLALVALLLPRTASSTTRTGHEFTYYSNAQHTQVVGDCIVCVGFDHCTGQITPYYTLAPYPCT